MQLKPINRDKQKKLKPIKQPVKTLRPQRQLHPTLRTQQNQYNANGINNNQQAVYKNDKQNRSKQILAHNVQPAVQQSHQPQKLNTKQSLCMQLLSSGNVQSFIDMFYISHKCLPNVMQKKNYFGQPISSQGHDLASQTNSQQQIQFYLDFSHSLTKAEIRPESTREQKQQAMNQYNSIAFNYQDQGEYDTAAYFYKRVIDLAIGSKNKQYELIAMLGLGKCYDQSNKKDEAIELLEDAFDMSSVYEQKTQRIEMNRLIGRQLIEIYLKKAEQQIKFHEQNNVQSALQSYQNGLKIAQRAKQLQHQAKISHKIGQLYYMQGRFQKSIQFQQQYLTKLHQVIVNEINKEIQMQSGQKKDQSSWKFKQMQAHAALAKCFLKLKNIQKSEEHLNQYNRMAKEAKAQNYVADSSYYLGKLFEEKNEKQKAIQYYQAYFQAAKSQKQDKKDRKLVDKARVTYAIAKANKNMQKYIQIFNQNDHDSLKKVLDWKIKRTLK